MGSEVVAGTLVSKFLSSCETSGGFGSEPVIHLTDLHPTLGKSGASSERSNLLQDCLAEG
jgi:hypothetical protein